jgi:hypothetical protein
MPLIGDEKLVFVNGPDGGCVIACILLLLDGRVNTKGLPLPMGSSCNMKEDEIITTVTNYIYAADAIFNTMVLKDGESTGRRFG